MVKKPRTKTHRLRVMQTLLAENPMVAFLCDAQGVVRYANGAAETVLRLHAGDALEEKLSKQGSLSYFSQQVRATGRVRNYPLEFCSGAEGSVSLLCMAALFSFEGQDMLVCWGLDMPSPTQGAAFARENRFLRKVLDTIPDYIFGKDREGRYTYSNKGFADFNGVRKEDIYGRRDQDFFSQESQAEGHVDGYLKIDAQVMAEKRTVTVEEWGLHADGRRQYLETIKAPFLDASDELQGLIGVSRDMTVRYVMERELRLSQEEAQAANRAKSDFLANMSHELRTPMNGIVGLAYLALQSSDLGKVLEYVDKIDKSAQILLAIINDILDFSKVEARKLEIEAIPFRLGAVLSMALGTVEVEASRKGLILQQEIDEDAPDWLVGDPVRLGQVLNNLLNNAVKFTSAGSVRLSVRAIARREDSVELAFSVTDTGIGIAGHQLNSIFAPFSQVDATVTRRYGGTGLGLAITKDLVDLMHGAIDVRSEPGKGSTFRFILPFVACAEADVPAGNGAPSTPRAAAADGERARLFAGVRVLLVEDNEINQLIATEILQGRGFLVETAVNGSDALRKARSGRFDLMLMDIQMPEMDGIEATRQLREDRRFDAVPIIAMTAHAMQDDYQKSLDAGMQEHVTKPIDPEQLFDVLEQWVLRVRNAWKFR